MKFGCADCGAFDSYIMAAALDGGTQVISFILNFAVFGASGTAHSFPDWWGNGTSPFS